METCLISRRQFLIRVGALSAVITVRGAALESATTRPWSETHSLPNADDAVTPAFGTRPELTPLGKHFRMQIGWSPPIIRESEWRLSFRGLVERPLSFTLDEIRSFEPMQQFVTLECISNPVAGNLIGTTRWTGVSLQRILQEIRLLPRANYLKIASADGFYEVIALDTIRRDPRVMLTYAWDGVSLSDGHGFPLRIYIPDLYGMKQPKWIQAFEAIDRPEEGYWVERGWDAVGRVKATSVIDTRGSALTITEKAGRPTLARGGIAFAGARGISKVQLRVDKEPWRDAQLRAPLSETTWVIWRYNWPFKAGKHTFTVRCFEGDGTPQIKAKAPPLPGGATGLHSIKIKA
jgi:DMSO/TMAO reductase YedYZ molybdopterin-dependent catalytic subunit